MTRYIMLFLYLTALTAAALAQSETDQLQNAGSPVAYVYVSRPTHMDGFAASSTGKLTPVPGSPFAHISVSGMSVNKKYLFGENGTDIFTFSIASDGALTKVSEIDAQGYNPGAVGTIGPVRIDATGTTVYTEVYNSADRTLIESFKIEGNGDLQFLGNADSGVFSDQIPLFSPSVLENNKYAYQGGDIDFDDTEAPVLLAYKRESNGLLSATDGEATFPNPAPAYYTFFLDALAPAPSDHLAFAVESLDYEYTPHGHDLLGTFTANSHGNLSTTSTYRNMISTDFEQVGTMSISPTGKLLAVAGENFGCGGCGAIGFQVFHFNGSSPITHDSGVLQPGHQFTQFGWDSANHLYALSADGLLFVYTVTPTSITEAPGSPYSIPEAGNLIVLEK
jgi:hypothetical protein